jgi:hypothetical protein
LAVSFLLAAGLFYRWLSSIRSEKFYPPGGANVSGLTVFSLRSLAVLMCACGIWISVKTEGGALFAAWSGMLAALIAESFFSIRNTRTQDFSS